MKKTCFLIVVIFFVSNLNIYGQSIVTDRPDQTESSVTVPKGSLQIESGMIFGFNEDGPVLIKELAAPITVFRIGITKGIEFRLLSQYEKIKFNNRTSSGISDIEVGAKIQLLRKENLNIAFITHLLTPTGTVHVSENQYGTINKLAAAYSVSDNFGAGVNLGYSYFGTGNGNFLYSLALAFPVNDKASFYIEPYGEITDLSNFVSNIDGGISYLITDNLQADFSVGTGINHRMNYLAFGISWRLLKNEK